MSLPGTVCFLLPSMVTLPLFFWLLYLGICPFMWSCVDLDLDSSSPCIFSEDLHGGSYNPPRYGGRDGRSSCTLDRPFSGYTARLARFDSLSLLKNQLTRGGHSQLCDPAGQARPGALGHWNMNIKGVKHERLEAGDRRNKGRRSRGAVSIGEGSQVPEAMDARRTLLHRST